MIKSELIEKLTLRQQHIEERDVALSVSLILEYLRESLASGTRVELRGFGSFNLNYHPPRQAHNPKTGKRVLTPAKYSPHFKPGKDLRDKIDANKGLYAIKSDEAGLP